MPVKPLIIQFLDSYSFHIVGLVVIAVLIYEVYEKYYKIKR